MSAIAATTAALGAAGATTAAAARGAFMYNRANYLFDTEKRFGRFTSGYSFAMAQASQYREDIRDLTALTTAKMDTYHVVGVIFFVLNFQLIMAGRLGVHGPSPPGWLMVIYWANIASALMYLCVCTWLSMHASARATSGGVLMLTRNVRLPIPTPKQLNKARKTGNSFEKQRVPDMFRIPFLAPAPKEFAVEEEGGGGEGKVKTTPVSNRRMPRWFGDEEINQGGGADPARGVPEHFELYRGLQQEWWGHDVYTRISILFFMNCWLTSASLYSQCHCFGELRAIWPAWTVTFMFVAANYCVLHMDIVNETNGRSFNIPVEYLAPFTPILCVLGMSLDYSILEPSDGVRTFIYVLSWICYVIHFLWVVRMYDLAQPHPNSDQPEVPGQPWWPAEWWLPAAFSNAVYLVAPPKKLEEGVPTCLQLEMKAAKGRQANTAPIKKGKTAVPPQLFPWRLVRGAILTNGFIWVVVMFGRIVEQANGERRLLKQEGRVERWPSHMQPWMPPWSRWGNRHEWGHAGGSDRRLAVSDAWEQAQVRGAAQHLAAAVAPITETLHGHMTPKTVPVHMHSANIVWPAELQPTLLAPDGKGSVIALTADYKGALLEMKKAVNGLVASSPEAFTFDGISELGTAIGASWSKAGLILTGASGAVAECNNMPMQGVWPCRKLSTPLPTGGSLLDAAVASRVPSTGQLRAALAFQGEESVAIFDLDSSTGSWLPAGEVQMPRAAGKKHHFAFGPATDELLFSTGDGGVLKWPLTEPEPSIFVPPQPVHAASQKLWHSACPFGGDYVLHLASPKRNGRVVPHELLISKRA